MRITTFGNSNSHHISINGKVLGPFTTNIMLIQEAIKNGVFLDKLHPHNIPMPASVPNNYYTEWRDEE